MLEAHSVAADPCAPLWAPNGTHRRTRSLGGPLRTRDPGGRRTFRPRPTRGTAGPVPVGRHEPARAAAESPSGTRHRPPQVTTPLPGDRRHARILGRRSRKPRSRRLPGRSWSTTRRPQPPHRLGWTVGPGRMQYARDWLHGPRALKRGRWCQAPNRTARPGCLAIHRRGGTVISTGASCPTTSAPWRNAALPPLIAAPLGRNSPTA